MITDYQQAVDYLYHKLPMFQRIGPAALKKDLTNTIKLCTALGNPQVNFKSIHIAGTNGKGSTAHMLASVLQTSGYKTGLYTSPHLKEFTERIKVNGIEVEKNFVVTFVNRIQPLIEAIEPSFFEITVAMAFDYFAAIQVDVAVVEVGLGGRLDSTNVLHPELSVITNIGMDHTDLLGDTLEAIALEKAGIIKDGVPVVISERQQELDKLFQKVAAERNSMICFASDHYKVLEEEKHVKVLKDEKILLDNLSFPLKGQYQKKNLPGVFQAIELLQQKGMVIDNTALRSGLETVDVLTGLKGRWQTLGHRPLTICDTGHNEEGIREVMYQISLQEFDALHIVLGMVKDKDIGKVLKLLPGDAHYYFCQSKIPRALEAAALEREASRYGLLGIVIPDVNQAIAKAQEEAGANDLIFIGGSTFVVAEIKNL